MNHSRIFLAIAVVWLGGGRVGERLRAHEAAEEMAEAAVRWRAALTPAQRTEGVMKLEDPERLNWHFIPRDRKGISLKVMTPAQRHLAMGLLSTALSHRGLLQATTIMSLEEVLKEIEQGKGPVRDPELYYVTVFGEPSGHGTWGWRFEGHHLSLNFLLSDGEVSVTPSMFGSNPAEVRAGPRRGLRVLGETEDLGRALVRSLSDEQRKLAVIAEKAPADVILGPDRKAGRLTPEGLGAAGMTAEQRDRLWVLVEAYVRRYRSEVADADLRTVDQAGRERLSFAWAGGLEPGEPHYFRVQGPTFILEYDNTQNSANHVHTAWREFAGDFGEDLLLRHYEQTPHDH